MLTYSITLLLLGAVFGVNLGLNAAKIALEDSAKEAAKGGSQTSPELNIIRALSISTSFLVVVINTSLGKIIRKLSSFEKHRTYSHYHLSVATKLTFALFINTGLIPLFSNLPVNAWFGPGGLVVDIYYNSLTVCFFQPIMYLISPGHCLRRIIFELKAKSGEKSLMTQSEANEVAEGPALDMA